MKNLRTSVVCACITLCSLSAAAQKEIPLNQPDYNKPRLFNNLPDQVPVDLNGFNSLLTSKNGNAIDVNFSTGFRFQGQVVSTSDATDTQLSSVVVRSSNYEGAVMTITKVTDPATGTISYVGRIISMKHGDLFELQNKNGQYLFVKKNFYDLINE
jgi:hypothetical protein